MTTRGDANEAPRTSPAEEGAASQASACAGPERGKLGPWIAAALLSFAIRGIDRAVELDAPEPVLLRWVRSADRHPLRLTLALGCLLLAARRGPGLPSRQSKS